MPCTIHFPSSSRHASTETAPSRVSNPKTPANMRLKTSVLCRFMSDKIMPLSEAVEGYDLFDKMKVQKGKRNGENVIIPPELTV